MHTPKIGFLNVPYNSNNNVSLRGGKCKNQIYNSDSYKEPLKHLRRTFKVSLQYKKKWGFLTS